MVIVLPAFVDPLFHGKDHLAIHLHLQMEILNVPTGVPNTALNRQSAVVSEHLMNNIGHLYIIYIMYI